VFVRHVRLVQVTIPSGKRETLLRALDDEGVDYVVSDETSSREYAAIAYVPVPTAAVEDVIAALRDAGLGDDAYTVVLDAHTVISRSFDELAAEYEENENGDRIAREELTAAAANLAPTGWTYVVMTLLSAIIATAGLLLDSPAIVVGSMVIAPLVGPALSASVGTVVNDREMFLRGVKLQVLGIAVAVGSATLFALLVQYGRLGVPIGRITDVPEITERVAPDFLSLVVALGAGAAGIISLISGISTALVGVMIAAALIPPAATVGIGLAWGQPLVALGSGVLVLVNVLSINLAALIVLWYAGYRPTHWFREDQARTATIKRVSVLVVTIVLLSVFLGGVTLDSFQRASVEDQLRNDAAAVVQSTDRSLADVQVELLDVHVEHSNTAIFRRARRLEVVVGVTPGETLTGLADRIDTLADATAGHDIDTRVTYSPIETA
jgi:uncharacterized hydrophobic protein (TIGR00341 family)